jgi:hypothetical protein
MLAIGVHEDQEITMRMSRPRLDGGSVAETIWMRHDVDTRRVTYLYRIVSRAVVYYEDLGSRVAANHIGQQAPEALRLIAGR